MISTAFVGQPSASSHAPMALLPPAKLLLQLVSRDASQGKLGLVPLADSMRAGGPRGATVGVGHRFRKHERVRDHALPRRSARGRIPSVAARQRGVHGAGQQGLEHGHGRSG